MEEDILKATARPKKETPKRRKISALGVILTIILAVVLIIFGERIIFDLNRIANPIVEKNVTSVSQSGSLFGYQSGLSSESSSLSDTRVYYPTQEKESYLAYKVIIHAAFIVPIFLLTFLFHFLFNVKRREHYLGVVMYAYMAFAIWMILHLLIELVSVINNQFPNSAIYIILGVLVVVFTTLTIFAQKKFSERHA